MYVSAPVSTSDLELLARAIELGRGGLGRVSPNPMVGALLVRDGRIIGEGFHERLGGPHAEVNAIEAARASGADPRGATLYVSLEPCCHQGRQPPCTEAIIAAGIARVVVASDDPTDKARGRGPGILRDEGIEVVVADGEVADRARLENQAFRKHAATGRPWVLFKAAMSLDGKVATRGGDSQWISCEASRALAHRWRAEVDAVAVGVGTAIADDPLLTARVPGVHRQPRRVIFDTTARLPRDARVLGDLAHAPLTVVVSRAARRADVDALEMAGADVLTVSGEHEMARVADALDQLGALDEPVTSVLLEGGPRLAGAFFDAGEIDEARFFVAPLLVGGSRARDPLEGEGVERIGDAMRAMTLTSESSGDDVLLRARLKVW